MLGWSLMRRKKRDLETGLWCRGLGVSSFSCVLRFWRWGLRLLILGRRRWRRCSRRWACLMGEVREDGRSVIGDEESGGGRYLSVIGVKRI